MDSPLEDVHPKAAGARGKAAGSNKVLQPSSRHNVGKAIEDIYQRKTQLEHILLRPDTYIGSTESQQQAMWVHDGEQMVFKTVSYVPGLYKIFDEILVNAADNKVRDPSMDTLSVDIDEASNEIRVWNNGDGVPVEIHKNEQVYVPELIFGHLLTSSNYNDTEKKVTGGRNGYGAKLANIFSTRFVIETCDGKRRRRYRQVFSNNMADKGEPQLSACGPGDNWTCVSFVPDLAKFGLAALGGDAVALMRKRVFDMAGVLGKGVKVFLNGKRLSIKSFGEYVGLYLQDGDALRVAEKAERWEVVATVSEGHMQQVSFVNSICTSKGGTHVNYIVDQITKSLTESINKKNKGTNVKPFMVRNYLSVFINCHIENPAFDSQTKETLTLRASAFGSKCELPDRFIKRVADAGVADAVLRYATSKQANDLSRELKKSDGAKRQRITGLPKLQDANDAGGRFSEHCTLILTEGDSAKSLVVDGLSVAGRNRFGVFPLRGKLLNVRDASVTQVTNNAEIQNIKQIMGLQHGRAYEGVKQLRYGHLMIMTDQDHDGSHIKGLIMNFFHHFYPTLLRVPGFLLEFITPIVKATKGGQLISFYSMPEYEAWKAAAPRPGWAIKYYKGLGTSTTKEAREYFSDIARHRKEFVWQGEVDDEAIMLAFSKKKVEERKQWLLGYVPGTYLDQTALQISYTDFVNRELILFSRADLERSIPSMVDGLKPGQRKILFACFKRKLRSDIKVAQLSGYVSEQSAYHHGEASLQNTIVGMAQNFVGSNNINYLVPSGQFGTRLQGGKDAASARYIYTRLDPIARALFHEADDQLLTFLTEEGQSIEPLWYVPIIPTVLVNGAEGIGTGWSTFIPNYNPRDLIAGLRALLAGEPLTPLHPWYRNFIGDIAEVPTKTAGKSYAISGTIEQGATGTLEVRELPVRKWTQDYKEFLEAMVRPEAGAAPLLADYSEHHTGASVHFSLQVIPSELDPLLAAGPQALLTKFKLVNKISIGNMVLFDAGGNIKRYESAEAILTDFFALRLDYCTRRRAALIKAAEFEQNKLSNKARFILAVVAGELVIANRHRADITAELEVAGYDKLPPAKKVAALVGATVAGAGNAEEAGAEEGVAEHDAQPAGASYDYLLTMPIASLTLEKVAALNAEVERQNAEVARLRKTSPADVYAADLTALEAALDARDAAEAAEAQHLATQQRRAAAAGARNAALPMVKARAKASKKKAAAADSDDSEDDIDMSEGDSGFEAPPLKARPPPKKAAPKPAVAAPSSLMQATLPFSRLALKGGEAKPLAVAPARKRLTKADAAPTCAAAAPAPSAVRAAPATLAKAEAEVGPAPVAKLDTQPYQQLAAGAETSLMDRLAGRMSALKVEAKADATGAFARAAAADASACAPATAANSASHAASDPDSDPGRGRSRVRRPCPAASAAAAKRKPRAKGGAAAALAAEAAGFERDAVSPAVAPTGKVRRMRPSPFHKGSNITRKPASGAASGSSEAEVEEVPALASAAVRPSRRAAAAAKKTYVELSSSSAEDVSAGAASDADSEFALSK